MESLKNSLNWFEIPVADFERAQKFYSAIYDYEMPSIVMKETTLGFFLVEQGGIGGAIAYGPGYKVSEEGALIYLNGGENLQEVLDRVEAAGGKILTPKTIIPNDLGYFATFKDSEGNKVALHSMK